jgi:hypothetical protein
VKLKDAALTVTDESPHLNVCITFFSAQNAVQIADIAKSDEFSICNFILLLSRFLQANKQCGVTWKQLKTCAVWSVMISVAT